MASGKPPNFDPEQFVRLWLDENRTINQIATELGVSRQWLYVYAARLRRSGVKLPKRNIMKIDVGALNEIISSKQEPSNG